MSGRSRWNGIIPKLKPICRSHVTRRVRSNCNRAGWNVICNLRALISTSSQRRLPFGWYFFVWLDSGKKRGAGALVDSRGADCASSVFSKFLHMKIAAAQISCSLGDYEANLLKVRDFSRRAKEAGAELIVFPEMVDTGYSMPVIQTHAASWTSGFVPGLQEIARELSIAIVSGVSERV